MILDKEFFETMLLTHFIDVVCDYCGKTSSRSKRSVLGGRKIIEKDCCKDNDCSRQKREESCLKKYGVKNSGGTSESLDKIKKTCFEKYGTENPNDLNDVKIKIKNTNLKKYGKTSFLATDECKKTTKEKCLKKHGVEFFNQVEECKEKAKQTSLAKYGETHYSKTDDYLDKVKQTCLEKYGVESAMKSDLIKNKLNKSMMEKHGVCYALQKKEFLDKFKQTCLERFGFDNYAKTAEYRDKYNATCLERFGYIHPLKNEIIKERSKITSFEKYGVNHYSKTDECKERYKNYYIINYNKINYFQTDECKEKSKNTCLEKYNEDSYSKTDEFKERYKNTCMEKYGVSTTLLLMKNRIYGKSENELKDYVNSFGFNFIKDYKVLNGKELDLYDESKKIAFEYCGLYWHSELAPGFKDKNYHFNKYKICKDQGIHLITIFEDEWKLKQSQCKNLINYILGIYNVEVSVNDCKINQITKEAYLNFNNAYCIEEIIETIICYGVFYQNELIGVISLSKHNNKTVVLNQICFKSDFKVIDGLNVLFKHCINWSKLNNYENIVAYSDNRWFNGKIYKKLNFELEAYIDIDFSYINLKKSKKIIPKNKIENKINYSKIWDCGKTKWNYPIVIMPGSPNL